MAALHSGIFGQLRATEISCRYPGILALEGSTSRLQVGACRWHGAGELRMHVLAARTCLVGVRTCWLDEGMRSAGEGQTTGHGPHRCVA